MEDKPKSKPVGRPTDYDPKYCDEIIKYFTVENYIESPVTITYKDGTVKEETKRIANDLPTLAGFCRRIGTSRETLNNWSHQFPEFLDAIKRVKEMQEEMLVTNGLQDLYAQPFAIFAAKNLIRWADKLEQTLTGGVDANGQPKPVGVSINGGWGFLPPNITIPASPTQSVGSTTVLQSTTIQSADMASEGSQDIHSNSGTAQAGTS